MIRRLIPVFLLTFLFAAAASAGDWPQWRGPDRTGHAAEADLLKSWPEGGPPLLWKSEGMGAGYASLAVVGERLFTTGDLEDGQYLIAVSAENGDALWKLHIGPVWKDKYVGSRSTPTIDGDRVYAISTEGAVVCADAATGKQIWRRHLVDDFGGVLMQAMGQYDWKFSESPLIDGDRLIATPGAPGAAVIALNKKTGEEIWRAAVPKLGERGTDGAAYSSAVVSEAGGVRQYVQLLGRGVASFEAETGRFLWGYNRVANDIANIATPIIDGDHVFVSTAYGAGSAMLRIHRDDKEFRAEEVYFLEADVLQNHHGGLIGDDGYVYGGTGHKKGFPISVEMSTGKVAWGPIRNEGSGSAAISMADGHLYFRYENGLMVLIEATPEEYRQKGQFQIPDVEQFSWSHPVIAGGKLYLREQGRLYCHDLRASGS